MSRDQHTDRGTRRLARFRRRLRVGSRSVEVTCLESTLRELGYTSVVGPDTVLRHQHQNSREGLSAHERLGI